MFHQPSPRPWYAAAVALGLVAAPLAAQQGSAPKPAAATPAVPASADSAKQPAQKSRFGRFGRVFEKAASTAADAGAKAGITRETAARLAVTAATGGAAAAMLQARQQSAISAATAASRALDTRGASRAPSAAPNPALAASIRSSLNAPGAKDLATEAVQAMTDLGQISLRAQQHDPAAMRAVQALNAAMAKPDAQFTALQHRATAGDPTAAQQIIIREDAIARAALGGSTP